MYFLDIMIELVNHEILVIFIDKDGIFLKCLFNLNKFVEILFCFKRSVEENIDFEDSNYRNKVLLEGAIIISLSFLILLLHRLNHFIVMSQGIDVVFLWVVFSRCLIVLKPWLLSYHIALLLWVDAHIFCSILILYWLPQTHKWTRYWLS